MLLQELIDRLGKSDANKQDIHVEDLQEILQYEFNIGMNLDTDKAQTRVTCYWLANWYEDEGWLGYKIYFLDDRLLAMSYTEVTGDEGFTFANTDIRKELRTYILTFEKDEEYNACMDLQVEMGDGYKLGYSYELVASHVMYKAEKCKVVESGHHDTDIRIEMSYIDTEIVITTDIKNVDVCYNII